MPSPQKACGSPSPRTPQNVAAFGCGVVAGVITAAKTRSHGPPNPVRRGGRPCTHRCYYGGERGVNTEADQVTSCRPRNWAGCQETTRSEGRGRGQILPGPADPAHAWSRGRQEGTQPIPAV